MARSYFVIIHYDDRDEIIQIIGFADLCQWVRMHKKDDYVVYTSEVLRTHIPEEKR